MIPNLKMQQAVEEAVRLTIQSFDGQIRALRKQAADDASELARLTAERDKLQRAVDAYRSPPRLYTLADMQGSIDRADAAEERASAAEAAAASLSADAARKYEQIARLRESLKRAASDYRDASGYLVQRYADLHAGKPVRDLQEASAHFASSAAALDALATTETTDA
jgi:chromosome segregation ATPase